MLTAALLFVLCSGLAHAVWNLFAKQSGDKSVFLWLITVMPTIIALPFSVLELLGHPVSFEAGLFLLMSVALQGAYALLLTVAYRCGDMSQVYPIMRGTPALLIPLAGVLAFGESLTQGGWAGLALLFVGFIAMSGWPMRRQNADKSSFKSMALALGVGMCVAAYVLVDKINVESMTPIGLLGISNLGFLLALTPIAVRSGQLKKEWGTSGWKVILLGSLLSPLSYLLFLFAMKLAPVGYIAPIREIGTVFGTVLGIVVLKERQGIARVCSSVLIAAGILLMGLSG